MEWLNSVCTSGQVPIHTVHEPNIPEGESGRLVTLRCGADETKVRELVPYFDEGSFDPAEFWGSLGLGASQDEKKKTGDEQEPEQEQEEDLLPNVGYRRIPPKQRLSYKGSTREALDKN